MIRFCFLKKQLDFFSFYKRRFHFSFLQTVWFFSFEKKRLDFFPFFSNHENDKKIAGKAEELNTCAKIPPMAATSGLSCPEAAPKAFFKNSSSKSVICSSFDIVTAKFIASATSAESFGSMEQKSQKDSKKFDKIHSRFKLLKNYVINYEKKDIDNVKIDQTEENWKKMEEKWEKK